jgi:hypothetical protein
VNENVSKFAAVPAVRRFLLEYQRSQAQVARAGGFRGLIMEGRDIGSVIFPEADFRFFLHADPVERARRRAAEGQTDSILERDRLRRRAQDRAVHLPGRRHTGRLHIPDTAAGRRSSRGAHRPALARRSHEAQPALLVLPQPARRPGRHQRFAAKSSGWTTCQRAGRS